MKLLRNPANRVWLILLLATGLSYWVGGPSADRAQGIAATWTIFGLACIKGWLVVDVFMGLRHAPRLWRRLLLGWLCGVSLLVVLIYSLLG